MSISATGGNFKCVHNIDTDDVNEWNDHCSDPANGHTESGTTLCVDCNSTLVFEGLPFHPITPTGKNIKERCPECFDSYTQSSRQNQVMKVQNPKKGYRMLEPHEKQQQPAQKQQSSQEEDSSKGDVSKQ